ncbi:MAG TPA: APC family permease [Vicinamibacterales bacterium]|nr:APC family permease [Vicinamibacterales bacterium]
MLGLGFGLAVIVGATLGIGILRTPGLVAGQLSTPSLVLLVWLVGGLYTLLGAVCFAELGTMLPEAGGYYVYARHAFGDTVGFAVGWTDWLTYCSVLGYVSIGIGEFTAILLPPLSGSVTIVAIAVLVSLVALQWAGVQVSSRFQQVATAVKFVAFLAVVVAAFVIPHTPVVPALAAPAVSMAGLIVALQAVVITYGGWQSALYFSEEDRDPNRNIPRSMIGGVVSVIIVYLLVNLALLSVLPIGDMARSTLPAADVARVLIGPRGQLIITVLSLISLPPMLNAILMIGTRILFGMGRDGLLWKETAAVNARGTPTIATLATTAVAVMLIASGSFQRLVAITAFFLALNYVICCLALFVLRRREPARVRPFVAWGYPWSAGIVFAGAGALLVGMLAGDTVNGTAALALLAAGLAGRAVFGAFSVERSVRL